MGRIDETPYEIIGNWIAETIDTSSWEKFNDLHIDDIDNAIESDKEQWLYKSFEFLNLANNLLPNKRDFLICLMVSLEGKIDWHSISYSNLTKYLDNTPPSLYMVHREWENWKETIQESKAILLVGIDLHFTTYVTNRPDGSSVLILF